MNTLSASYTDNLNSIILLLIQGDIPILYVGLASIAIPIAIYAIARILMGILKRL